ncbi:pentatricopeptide repeat-containing protein At3g04130, mitochondrial isoform X1 [Dendrobium catenatum]|uniref:Pentatricopeptide repeat-containing protein n=1 Tax=Dendrobium catenatum TaxID=906689 RepID=A0A2I0X144_9ASPA|nr:pentatricopeptide repeat-containing protein At3g04130, mitochondrial isoform X1 [Dendrobium catenatum]PKU81635.1 Pentatricopeptide repeat-containing protein [Dendrobium catenatum]
MILRRKGLLDVSSPTSLYASIARRDLYFCKVLIFTSSACLSTVFRNFEANHCMYCTSLPLIGKENKSIKSTSDHEVLDQFARIHDFVLGPEEHECAHKIRCIILNLQSRNVNVVMQALQSNHNFHQMQLTTNTVDSLLQNFGDDWQSAMGFFQWAGSRPGYKHTTYAYNKIVDLLGKMKQIDHMWDLVEKMRIEGFITLETVAKIMRRLVGAGRWKDAVSFFDDLGRIGLAKDTETMNFLLDTLCKEKKVEVAREVFMELKAQIPADAYTFNIFVHGWCIARRIEEAIWTIQEMRGYGFQPSVITYSTILMAHCKQSNFCKVYEVLDEMVADDCPPNVVTYTIIINSLARTQDVEQVLDVVNRMKSSGCKPDTRFYNTLINILGKAGRLDDAFHIFEIEMGMNGVKPDISTYNIMISIFCQHNQEQNALHVLKEIEYSPCKPVLQTYNPLLKLCFRMGKIDDQLKSLLSDITTKHHLSFDLDTYTLLIHGLCGTGHVEWAYFLFNEMLGQEIVPRIRTCRLLMDLAIQKNMDVAVERIKSLISRSKV